MNIMRRGPSIKNVIENYHPIMSEKKEFFQSEFSINIIIIASSHLLLLL